MKQKHYLAIAIAAVLVAGCGTDRAAPRFAGTIFAHAGSADSETGTSHMLTESGSVVAGFNYGDAESTDWDAKIDWSFLALQDSVDIYRLNWTFTPESGATVSGTSDIAYDGENQAVAVVNDQLTVTIGPRITRDARPSYADEPASLLGKPSPELLMSTLDGKSMTKLSNHVGKIVVMQFWASWISTNYAPVARMQDIAERNESWAGKVELFTVSVDRDREQAARIVSTHRWNRTKNLAVDIDKLEEFGISTLPATIIIAADGTIESLDVSIAIDIEKEVNALLNDPSEVQPIKR